MSPQSNLYTSAKYAQIRDHDFGELAAAGGANAVVARFQSPFDEKWKLVDVDGILAGAATAATGRGFVVEAYPDGATPTTFATFDLGTTEHTGGVNSNLEPNAAVSELDMEADGFVLVKSVADDATLKANIQLQWKLRFYPAAS